MDDREYAEKLAERLTGVGGALHGVPGYTREWFMNEAMRAFAAVRADAERSTIERCAKEVERIGSATTDDTGALFFAASIRALADKASKGNCRWCGQSKQNHADRIGAARDCAFEAKP